MEVVPHIVIGLHYGRILGEPAALDIVSRHPVHSLVLVVVMPFYARPGTFATPATSDVGRIFLEARRRIPDRQVLLGCARPPGMHRRVTDAYAVIAGLDGIAFPADGALAVARGDRPAGGAGARLLLDQDRAHDQASPAPGRGGVMATERADVLVLGLGPGGRERGRGGGAAGLRVIAVDRKREPGRPVQCAEFVPAIVGIDVGDLAASTRQRIRSMLTFVEGDAPDVKANFPGHMLDRAAFDAGLVARAAAAGAACRFGGRRAPYT